MFQLLVLLFDIKRKKKEKEKGMGYKLASKTKFPWTKFP